MRTRIEPGAKATLHMPDGSTYEQDPAVAPDDGRGELVRGPADAPKQTKPEEKAERLANIRNLAAKMSAGEDKWWNKDGTVKVTAVEEALDDKGITGKDIKAALPEFDRQVANKRDIAAAENQGSAHNRAK